MEEKYELITLFDAPTLYADWRMDDSRVPDGLHKYEVRYDDDQRGDMAEVSDNILVDFMGTILSKEPIEDREIEGELYCTAGGIPIELDDYNYTGELLTIEEYIANYGQSDETSSEDEECEEETADDDNARKLQTCTLACNLISMLDSINDAGFVDEVISCVANNDAFTLGQLAAEYI